MPHTPATTMVRVPPLGTAGPPCGPFELRVSMSRHGVIGNSFEAALGGFAVTVTVAVLLSAEPQLLLTRTQYDVVVVGATVRLEELPPETGVEVSPEVPMYH